MSAVAIAAVGGLVVGGLAGFALAVVQLAGKRRRNARLVRSGEPPIRDCVLISWHLPCAVAGGAASGLLTVWVSPARAIALGGLSLPLILSGLLIAVALFQRAP